MPTPRKNLIPRFSLGKATPRKNQTPGKPTRNTPRNTPRKTPRKQNVEPAQNDGGEEGTVVAIRMRPLNSKESTSDSATSATASRVWRVLPQYNSVTQTTNTGQPLSERVTGRTFFAFDKTFGEDATTTEIYDGVAKGIVQSVATGLNGTIFAYGQTSSGKTYTMQGSGSIEEGHANGGGGIVHMAANEIFSHIANTPDRMFLVRTSFIEIYNEEVRDLLGDNNVLQIREDPRRGVFVNSNEEIVTDFDTLLSVLFAGEKNRAVASTGMNDRSSRSHTIFRITIESRQKGGDGNDENAGDTNNLVGEDADDGAVRISTLNLVDLAGSESVRHTGATGDRQKEGGKINQSLLTLSRVIVGLGDPNQTHINFRDSKLTRILQPSLSGNARMAVICCATPSELYLEETRSTLLFASRAKLVKTRAQVNEVLDDRSLIKRLQRELAEARKQGSAPEHLQALKTEAVNAGTAAREAEEKLKRLKSSLLNSGVLFGADVTTAVSSNDISAPNTKKRRLSDGDLIPTDTFTTTPSRYADRCNNGKGDIPVASPQSEPRGKRMEKTTRTGPGPLSPNSELALVKAALTAKSELVGSLEGSLIESKQLIDTTQSKLSDAYGELEELRVARDEAESKSASLSTDISLLRTEQSALKTEKDASIYEALYKLEKEQTERASLEEIISKLREENSAGRDANTAASSRITELIGEKEKLQMQFDKVSEERVRGAFELAQANSERDTFVKEREENRQRMQELVGQKDLLIGTMQETVEEKDAALDMIQTLKKDLSIAQEENGKVHAKADELAASLSERSTEISCLRAVSEDQKTEMELLKGDYDEATAQVAALTTDVGTKNETIEQLQQQLGERIEQIADLEETFNKVSSELTNEKAALQKDLDDLTSQVTEQSAQLDDQSKALNVTKEENGALRERLCTMEVEHNDMKEEAQKLKGDIEKAAGEKSALDSKLSELAYAHEVIHKQFSAIEVGKAESDNEVLKLSNDLEAIRSDMLSTVNENDQLETTVQQLTDELENAAATTRQLKSTLDAAEGKVLTFEVTVAELEANKSNVELELQAISGEKHDVSEQVQLLRAKKNELESRLEVSIKEIEGLSSEKTNLSREVSDHVSTIVQLTTERDDAISTTEQVRTILNETKENVTALETSISNLNSKKATKEMELQAVSNERDDLAGQLQLVQAEKSELQSQLGDASTEIEALISAKADASSVLEDRDSTVAQLMKERDDAISATQQGQAALDEVQAKIAAHEATIASSESHKDELSRQVQQLQTDNSQFESRLEGATTEIGVLSRKNAEIISELANRDSTIVTLTTERDNAILSAQETRAKLNEAEEMVAAHKATIEGLESDRDDMSEQMQQLHREMAEVESRLGEAMKKIETISTEKASIVRELQASLTVGQKASSLETKLDELESELTETKLLLAAANESVNEARAAALAADDEVEEKERKLEETTQLVSQRDEALRLASEQIKELESRSLSLPDSESHEEVLKDMELLMEEKLRVEAALDKERNERKTSEEELKRLMGEEQRELIKEAEITMSKLRDEAAHLKETLSQTETEAYAARQEVEELQDQLKTVTNMLSKAEDDSKQAEREKSDQNVQMNRLKTQLESAEKALSAERDLKEEETSAELSRAKAECYAAKQEILDLKDQLERIQQEGEVSSRNVTVLQEKVKKLDNLIPALETENQKLRVKIGKLATAERKLAGENKENIASAQSVAMLEQQVKEMGTELKNKDNRIKKLESVRLTKEQCAALKKMKGERATFQKEVEEYKTKLAKAEKEISSLRSRSSIDVQDNSGEISELKFAKEALETKFRKYAAHCQRLEGEKASIIDALKSCHRDVVDGDFAGAVVALCDKLSSLEEECDALSSAEGRASSYLMEMDRLRDENEDLQKHVAKAQDRILKLNESGADLQMKIAEAQEKMESLREERDQLRNTAESAKGNVADLEMQKSRQVRYLEQENLQLMLDLKNAKTKLKSTKAELEVLRMRTLDDNTEDFGAIALGDVAPISQDGPVAESPPDKENRTGNSGATDAPSSVVKDSARKRRSARATRSSRKKRQRGTPGRTIGLGEAGVVNESDNGEQQCNQS